MYTTYYIENSNYEIQAYYTQLKWAKYDLVKMFKSEQARIVCLKGQYKYEGRHAYFITHDGTKFRRSMLK